MEMLLGESVREEWEDWEDWYSSLFTLSFDAGTARLTLLGNGDVYFNS